MFINGPIQSVNVFVENSLHARRLVHSLILLPTHLKNPIPPHKIIYILGQRCFDFELLAIKLAALPEAPFKKKYFYEVLNATIHNGLYGQN